MKKHLQLCLFIFGLFTASTTIIAQVNDSTTTIILVRHAEKDTIPATDPELTEKGKQRAQKLPLVLQAYKPDDFFSTPFKRTKQTLQPWSEKTGKELIIYNPQNLEAFSEALKRMKGKTLVAAGHSNTIPTLVNLLLGSSKYQALDDSVYNKIFIVTLKESGATDKVIAF